MTDPDAVTLAELARGQMRIEHKLDRVTEDHERRLRQLERAVWIATGTGAAGFTSGLAALLGVIG